MILWPYNSDVPSELIMKNKELWCLDPSKQTWSYPYVGFERHSSLLFPASSLLDIWYSNKANEYFLSSYNSYIVSFQQKKCDTYVLDHPWLWESGEALDKSADSAVLSRMRLFKAMNKLKKHAHKVLFRVNSVKYICYRSFLKWIKDLLTQVFYLN